MTSPSYQLQNKDSAATNDLITINEDIVACIDCDKIFKSDEVFFAHAKTCQPIRIRKKQTKRKKSVFEINVQCDQCGNYYANTNSLQNHTKNSHGTETFICFICGTFFKSRKDLNSHIINHNEATIPCDQCDQVYKKRNRLRRHINVVHLKIKNHKCDLCDKRFGTSKALRDHKTAIHEKLKPFACLVCEFKCAKYGNLNLHSERKHGISKMSKTEYNGLVTRGRGEHPFLTK